MNKQNELIKISSEEYNKLHADFRGVWATERNDLNDWNEPRHLYMGKRTMLQWVNGKGTCLLIEGLHFEIIEDQDKP